MNYQVQYTGEYGCYYYDCETLQEAKDYAESVKEWAGVVEIYQLTLVADVK